MRYAGKIVNLVRSFSNEHFVLADKSFSENPHSENLQNVRGNFKTTHYIVDNKMTIRLISYFLTTFFLFDCNGNHDTSDTNFKSNTTVSSIPTIDYSYTNSYPHDTTSFTEGLLVYDGKLYESTGATTDLPQTKSLFGTVDTATGKIAVKVELDRKKYFGEGITFLNGKVYQLTYKTKVGFIYDATTFRKIRDFTFASNEGWGLTTDGKNLIMSDGTNTITYLDPNSLQVIKKIFISENGYVKDYVNELEYINGFIYANIWTTNTIVKIDTGSGKIVGKMDFTYLANEAKNLYPRSLEMNGIAYDPTSDKFLLTGKLWPKIYQISFSH